MDVGVGMGCVSAETLHVNMPNAIKMQPVISTAVFLRIAPIPAHRPPVMSMPTHTQSMGPSASRTDGGVKLNAHTPATMMDVSCPSAHASTATLSHNG